MDDLDKDLLERFKYARMRDMNMHVPQDVSGPLEHREFVRNLAEEGNAAQMIAVGVAIPGYTALKALGVIKNARSPASVDEIFAGYEGLYEAVSGKKIQRDR